MIQKNLIYDVGMCNGDDTNFYLKKGFNVIAFEADPELVAFCRDRFSDAIKTGQLIIVEGAIVDTEVMTESTDKVTFFKNKGNNQWGTVCQNWVDRNERCDKPSSIIEASVIDFAACLNRYGIPHYLKIDIEGMDVLCLKALLSFSEKPNYISLESNKVDFEALKREFDLLCKLGYNSFQVINQAEIPYSKTSFITKEGIHVEHVFTNASSGLFGNDLPEYGWIDRKKAIQKYRWIFLKYLLYKDDRFYRWRKYLLGKIYYRILGILISSPGWYDTHARR
ncbi:FkbM family methyltransferase [Parabacteroides timonensis]|uniref:FkbM family methyltransferase n=1 Tax=Parabacteroides timonensis TaxID=1871013 RepID=UPI0009E3B0B9|nr:FkbM family methyltransferase [Parabacteroides timonensis]